MFVIRACFFVILLVIPVHAATLRVPGDHPTVQQAIQAAQEGDRVLVAPGEYDGVVTMRSGITLQGSGNSTRFSETIAAFNVQRVVISSLQVQGVDENSHFGIFCRDADLRIEHVTIRNFHHGINAENSHLVVRAAKVTNGFNVGLLLTLQTEATLEENTIISNAVGIIISATSRLVRLQGNRIAGNRIGAECYDADPQLRGNTITGNGVGMIVDRASPDLGTRKEPGRNVFTNNEQAAIRYEGKDFLLAQGNWWGYATGPVDAQIQGNVHVEPWLYTDPRTAMSVRQPDAYFPILWGTLKYGMKNPTGSRR